MTPYRIYHPLEDIQSADTHGQGWIGETVGEPIALCPTRTLEPVLRKYISQNYEVLEAGCGLGTWVFYLNDLGYRVTGIELSDEAIRIARGYAPDAPIEKQDLLHMTYHDGRFGAVISLGLLEHFEEGPEAALAEIRRVLRPGGFFCVTVPVQNLNRRFAANPLKSLKRIIRRRRGVRFAFEEYRYTRREFSRRLLDAGFEIVETGIDEFLPPKCIGLYVDYPFFHHHSNKWELNAAGAIFRKAANIISPWLTAGGAYWICRKG